MTDTVRTTAAADLTTVLVSMPFADADRPSIQLGLLKAIVAKHGFPVRTLHANLDFAARVGVDLYRLLAGHRGCLLGEWLFSVAAFGAAAPDPDGHLLDEFAAELSYLAKPAQRTRELLLRMRNVDVPAYLDGLVDEFPWAGTRVVGFTSTFQQNTGSFALARRLKQRHPGIVTVFGGANFDGVMGTELVRAVDCVDFAVIGEGDLALPQLLSALAHGRTPDDVPGVARFADGRVVSTPGRPTPDLDDLPVPDYDEFFEHAEELALSPQGGHRNVRIPVETARGCWWGERHHCTFCGLNGTGMRFRAKSPERAVRELAELARRYRSFRFDAVDNILDVGYLKTVLPALVQSGTNYEMFYEVKANLTRAHLRLARQAGIVHVQPGLESLSTNVLRLMRKGVSAAQNVNLLKWARYYGIDVSWNLLWGFPGETEQDYTSQTAVVPHLLHLRPPQSADRVWLERFSPLYEDQEHFRLLSRAPHRSYGDVYPRTVDLDRIAYFFDYEVAGALPDRTYTALRHAVGQWSRAWQCAQPPVLKYWSAPHAVQIYDGRTPGHEGSYLYEGVMADIYLACDERPITAPAVRNALGPSVSEEVISEAFIEFQQRGLMFLDGTRALSLAVPVAAQR